MRRYGKKIYVEKEKLKVTEIGNYICPICKRKSKVMERKNAGFRSLMSVCEKGHNVQIDKELYQRFHVGDMVRVYETTFGKDSVCRLDCYNDGVIVKVYPDITDWRFDMKIITPVMNGKPLPLNSWCYGHIVVGHAHHRRDVKLLKKAPPEYVQMTLKFE